MKEFVEKLIERLEELGAYTCSYCINEAIEIVKDLASEHNNGWISCEEKLPDTEHITGVSETVLVTTKNNSIFTAEYHNNGIWLDDVADWSLEVIAWQPLPAPYKKGE